MASISHNITFVGTLQSNRRNIPIEVENVAERQRFSCQCFWESSENRLVLHSYVFPTKSSGQRKVLLLSTVELILGVTIDDGKKKPAICKLLWYKILLKLTRMWWNIELVPRYTCKVKSNPRTLTAFCCILNVHRVNPGTALAFNKKIDLCKQDSYDFGMNFAFSIYLSANPTTTLTGLW